MAHLLEILGGFLGTTIPKVPDMNFSVLDFFSGFSLDFDAFCTAKNLFSAVISGSESCSRVWSREFRDVDGILDVFAKRRQSF
jgi:hypothetical protein